MNTLLRKFFATAATSIAAVTLVACGGGDGGSYLTLRGVAATGLAVANGTVSVQCASGTGTATTNPNGGYSISVANGEGPCLVTVTKDSLTLRSIAPKTTNGVAVANVTPISDAIVTALVTSKGANSAAALVTNAAYVPTNTDISSAVTAAITQINAALVAAGFDPLPLNTDLLGKADYVAATSTTASTDPLDIALDRLVPAGSTTLPSSLTSDITSSVQTVVTPNPTGSTGSTGSTGASGGVN